MRVRDLGPLIVEADGREQPVAGTKGAAMLALLTIHANQHVSVDALTTAAWGERVSAGAASTLASHVWRLRQLLEPDRRTGEPPQVLLNDGDGYRLVASSATVDSLFFAEAAARVRDWLASGKVDEALAGADAALARWRGRPYGPAADAEWAQPAVARLDELRSHLQERRIMALVGRGALDTALSDLRPLIAAMPFHESLRALQMEALHRSGRTEQALEVFADTRRTLVDEIGIEPGRDLQELHRRILDDDPSLTGPRMATAPSTPTARSQGERRPTADPSSISHLPPSMTPLVGRDSELQRLRELVHEHRLVTVSGPAGCGKTRLAVEVARMMSAEFDDGVWFVDLVGVDEPSLVVDVVISTIGFVPSADATPVQDLANYLSTRWVLLVLDNYEHLLAGVVPMVEEIFGNPSGNAHSRMITTSRERLAVAGEVGWTLEPLALPSSESGAVATDAAAVQLLLQRLRAADPTLNLDEQDIDDVVRICVALDGLPLPLELAAARAPAFTLAEIVHQVSTEPGRLRRPGHQGHDHRAATLRSTIDRSYRLLTERERTAHRHLTVLPGPFTEAAVSAVLAVEPHEAEDTLVELIHRSMLTRASTGHHDRPTTFRQLVTVRDHGQHASTVADAVGALLDRRDSFTAELIDRRPPLGTPDEPDWFNALDDDQATVRATLTRLLIDQPSSAGGLLAAKLPFYWYYRGRLVEATRWLTLGHELLLTGDPHDLAIIRLATAAMLTQQRRHAQARPYFDAAVAFQADRGNPRSARLPELLVGMVAAAWLSDNHPLVIESHQHLLQHIDATTSPRLRLLADAARTMAMAASGQLEAAVALSVDVRQRATALNVPMARWLTAAAPLAQAIYTAQPDIGIPWTEGCMADHFPSGTGAGGAFIETRANFAAQQSDDLLAARLYGAAYSTTRRVGLRWPWRELTLALIEMTKGRVGEAEFNRLWRAGQTLSPLQVLDGLRNGWSDSR